MKKYINCNLSNKFIYLQKFQRRKAIQQPTPDCLYVVVRNRKTWKKKILKNCRDVYK